MIKKFLKHSMLYALVEGGQKGLLFLMTPILTYYMSPEEYGLVSSSLMIVSFLAVIVSLSIHGAINRHYYSYDGENRRLYLSSVFTCLVGVSILFFCVLLLISPRVFPFIFPEITYKPYVFYIISISVIQPILTALITLFKIKQDFRAFFIFYNAYFFSQIVLLLIFVVVMGFEANGYLLAVILSNSLFSIMGLIYLYDLVGFGFKVEYVKKTLSYSLPLMPVDLLALVNSLIDRYYILTFLGIAGVGVFYIGVQISALIVLLTLAINSAYVPLFFKALEDDNEMYANLYMLADLFVAFSCCVFVFVAIFGGDFVHFFYSDEFWGISSAIPLMSLTAGMTSIYFINTNILSSELKLIKIKIMIIVFGVMLNLSLGWKLTQLYGLYGAALSTLLSSVMVILLFISVVKIFTKFKFNNYRHFLLVSISILFVGAVNHGYIFDASTVASKSIYYLLFIGLIAIYSYKIFVIAHSENNSHVNSM